MVQSVETLKYVGLRKDTKKQEKDKERVTTRRSIVQVYYGSPKKPLGNKRFFLCHELFEFGKIFANS